ncbi:Myosin 10A, isoform D [Rhizophlyctis rosea]|uniref:Myosin 10A, isoform D n=1 Tax=Rhizophlyctis rosea TaxID=64517 RepID=A0AAD5SGZ9_9FUNG|nr:Myosin 10A, isoform D [Rhizophlyctis rosea]
MSLRVVTAHQASESEELELEVGDVVELDQSPASIAEYWWHGVNRSWGPNNGQTGFFPRECVKLESWEPPPPVSPPAASIAPDNEYANDYNGREVADTELGEELEIPTPVPPGTQVTVIMDYEMMKADEINLTVGEAIVITSSPEGGWWRGMKDMGGKNPKQGWFPATHVKVDGEVQEIPATRSGPLLSQPSSATNDSSFALSSVAGSSMSLNEGTKRKPWFKRMVPKTKTDGMKGKRSRSLSAPLPGIGLGAAMQGKSLSALPDASETSLNGPSLESLPRPSITASMTASVSAKEERDNCEELAEFPEPESGHRRSHSAPAVSLSDLRCDSEPEKVEKVENLMERNASITTPDRMSVMSMPPEVVVKTRPSSIVEFARPSVADLGRPSIMELPRPKSFAEDISKSWQDQVLPETVEAMSAVEKKRVTAIWELVETERDYVRDLVIIIEHFMKPLADRKILAQKQIETLFMNIPQLLTIHEKFLSRLQAKWSEAEVPDSIGDLLMDGVDHFVSYTLYCGNQTAAVAKMNNWKESKKEFRAFLEETYKNPVTRSLDLGGFLIKPVQRICKYPLLIREIQKYTDEKDPDHAQLRTALERVQGVISIVNEGARQVEGVRNIASIQAGFTERLNIATPTRHFVREDIVWIHFEGLKKPRRLFVFNDLLILARKDWRDKYHLIDKAALRDVRMADVSDDAGSNLTNYMELEIVPTDGGQSPDRYLLSTQTQAAKHSWLDTYRNLTQLAVRTKRLSETKSSSSAQLHSDNEDDPSGRRRRRQSTADQATAKELEQLRAEIQNAAKRATDHEEKCKAEKAVLESILGDMQNKLQENEVREAELAGKLRNQELESSLKLSEVELEGKQKLDQKQEEMDAKLIEVEIEMANQLRAAEDVRMEIQKSLEEARDRLAIVEQALATVRKQAATFGTEKKELAASNDALKKQVEDLVAERDSLKELVESLRKKMAEAEVRWSERLSTGMRELREELDGKHATVVDDLRTEHAAVIDSMQTKQAKMIEELQAKHSRSLEEMHSRHAEEVKSLHSELAVLRERSAGELERLRHQVELDIKAEREEADAKLSRQREEADAKLASYMQDMNTKLAEQKEQVAERVHALQALAAREQEKTVQVQTLTADLQSLRSNATGTMEGLKRDLEDTRSRLREQEGAFRSQVEHCRQLTHEKHSLEDAVKRHEQRISELQSSAQAAHVAFENDRKRHERASEELSRAVRERDAEIKGLRERAQESHLKANVQETEAKHLKEALEAQRKSGAEANVRAQSEIANLKSALQRAESNFRKADQAFRNVKAGFDKGQAQYLQVQNSNKQLAIQHEEAKAAAKKLLLENEALVKEKEKEKEDGLRKIAGLQSQIQSWVDSVREMEAEQKNMKEQLNQESNRRQEAMLRADSLEGKIVGLKEGWQAEEREMEKTRQLLHGEINTLRQAIMEEKDYRLSMEREHETLRSRLLDEARNDKARLASENEELKAKLQQDVADLRDKKDMELTLLKGQLSVSERLEWQNEQDLVRLKAQVHKLQDELREKASTTTQSKRRLKAIETENAQLTQRLNEVTAAAETSDAENRQFEGTIRAFQTEIDKLRTLLTAAETDYNTLQHRMKMYNELDQKYLDIRDRAMAIDERTKDCKDRLSKTMPTHIRRARDLVAFQTVYKEVAKALSVPVCIFSEYDQDGGNTTLPLDEAALMTVVTKIHSLVMENEDLRGQLPIEKANMEVAVESERLAKAEVTALAEDKKQVEAKLRRVVEKYRAESERTHARMDQVKQERDMLQMRLDSAQKAVQVAEDRVLRIVAEKEKLNNDFLEIYERSQRNQAQTGREISRLTAQVATLTQEVVVLGSAKAEADGRVRQLEEKLQKAESEAHWSEQKEEISVKTHTLLQTATDGLRHANDNLNSLKSEIADLQKWKENAEKRLDGQRRALERNVATMASAGEELHRRSAAYADLKKSMDDREAELLQELSDSRETAASLQVELVQAQDREVTLQNQLDIATDEVQRRRLQKEQMLNQLNAVQEARDGQEKRLAHFKAQTSTLQTKLHSLQNHIVNNGRDIHLSRSALTPSVASLSATPAATSIDNILSRTKFDDSEKPSQQTSSTPSLPIDFEAQISHLTTLIRTTESILSTALQSLTHRPLTTAYPSPTTPTQALQYFVSNASSQLTSLHQQENLTSAIKQTLENLSTARDLLQHLEDGSTDSLARRDLWRSDSLRRGSSLVGGRMMSPHDDVGLMMSSGDLQPEIQPRVEEKKDNVPVRPPRLAAVKLDETLGRGLGKSIEQELNRRGLVGGEEV